MTSCTEWKSAASVEGCYIISDAKGVFVSPYLFLYRVETKVGAVSRSIEVPRYNKDPVLLSHRIPTALPSSLTFQLKLCTEMAQNTEECAICLDELQHRGGVAILNMATPTGCGHSLHLSCFTAYSSQKKATCPVCRQPFNVGVLPPSSASRPPALPVTPQRRSKQPGTSDPPTPRNGWLNVDPWEIPNKYNDHLKATLIEIYSLLSWSLKDPSFSRADYYRLGYMPERPGMLVINVFDFHPNNRIKLSINTASSKVTPKVYSAYKSSCASIPRDYVPGLKQLSEWVFAALHPQRSAGIYVLPAQVLKSPSPASAKHSSTAAQASGLRSSPTKSEMPSASGSFLRVAASASTASASDCKSNGTAANSVRMSAPAFTPTKSSHPSACGSARKPMSKRNPKFNHDIVKMNLELDDEVEVVSFSPAPKNSRKMNGASLPIVLLDDDEEGVIEYVPRKRARK
ncbi:hypothetical protein BC830DRAFT_1222731 [Chytriomyces sp. MP71]|nr:hypothetical protein BC830DRAFT_1222731 [Chytriomyces sp. MP71]